jgi:hypothetical protein
MNLRASFGLLPLLALAFGASAATPLDTRFKRETISVDFLLETCTVIGETAHGMVPHFDCESYLYGVLDAHRAIRDALPKEQRACFPADLAPWQVYQLLLESEIGAARDSSAAALVITKLRARYPCE